MKSRLKKIASVLTAFAVAFTAVIATDVTTAQAASDWVSVYTSEDYEFVAAGQEVKCPFTLEKSAYTDVLIYAVAAENATLTLYNSTGEVVTLYDEDPVTISSEDWKYDSKYGTYYQDGFEALPAGDYTYGIKCEKDNYLFIDIAYEKAVAKISQSTATVTVGFTKKLSVEGAKVKSWTSSKKSVATVDKKGKVTAKKAGKTTIKAKLDNGETLKCVVTVKANKYSYTKPTVSDVNYGDCVMSVYSASFDKKGNLVVKARVVNNNDYKIVALNDIKIIVTDENGKTMATYKQKKKSVSIAPGSTKDLSFTISKSSLKKKNFDLRNAMIISAGGSCTYVW